MRLCMCACGNLIVVRCVGARSFVWFAPVVCCLCGVVLMLVVLLCGSVFVLACLRVLMCI